MLVGLKPARGLVPADPYDSLWGALGTAGPIATTAEDCSLIVDVIAGIAPASRPSPSRRLRIGVVTKPANPLTPPHPEHLAALRAVSQAAQRLGHHVEWTELHHPDPTGAFLTQFLAGIRSEIDGLDHPGWIEPRHKNTYRLGFWAKGAVLRRAERFSERLGARLERYFEDYDLILSPTVACRPARAGILDRKGSIAAQLASLSSVAYTALWNVSGHPAIAMPAGRASDRLPVSVQLVAARGGQPGASEHLLAGVAAELTEELTAASGRTSR